MSCRLNRQAYQRLIQEDIDWLLRQPRSLERDHVHEILLWMLDNRPAVDRTGEAVHREREI